MVANFLEDTVDIVLKVVETVVFPENKMIKELENAKLQAKKNKAFNSDTVSRKDMERFKADCQKRKEIASAKPAADPKLDLSCLAPTK